MICKDKTTGEQFLYWEILEVSPHKYDDDYLFIECVDGNHFPAHKDWTGEENPEAGDFVVAIRPGRTVLTAADFHARFTGDG